MNHVVSSGYKSASKAAPYELRPATLLGIIGAIAGIVVIAYGAHITPYYNFDLEIARGVQAIPFAWFDALMRAVSYVGYPPQVYGWVVAVLAFLWFSGKRWEAVGFIFVTVGIGVIGLIVKIPVDRVRPSPDLIYVANPALDNGKYSFPAGHVQVVVAIFGYLMYLIWQAWKRLWYQILLVIFLSTIIVLMGVSRVYMGEHWFSDVIGAYLIGMVWLWISIRFYEWGKPRFITEHARQKK